MRALVRDILDELADMGESGTLRGRIDAVLSRMACHGSVRAGRRMRRRGDERAPARDGGHAAFGSVQPRPPTWVALELADIERLFARR
jgi:DNA mismatch repair protein MutL